MPTRKKSEKNYEKRIVQTLRQLTQHLDKHSRQLLKEHDVTIPQVMCLDALCDIGAMAVAQLATHLHLQPSTIVGIIDRLEKKAFVTRTRDLVDRRVVFINITDQGRRFIIATPHLLHNKLHGNLQKLTKSEQKQIAKSLTQLMALMEEPEPI